MKNRSRMHRFAPMAIGAALAMCASVALAQGKGADDEDSGTPVERACHAMGCPGGNRQCGTVSRDIWVWLWTPWFPVPWKFTESGTCYEPQNF